MDPDEDCKDTPELKKLAPNRSCNERLRNLLGNCEKVGVSAEGFDPKQKNKKSQNYSSQINIIYFSHRMETAEQAEIVLYINMICTPFSLAGVFYMIYSYFKANGKNFTNKLVFCLALSDLLITVVDLLEIFYPNTENCTVIGFLRVTGIYSNMLWTT